VSGDIASIWNWDTGKYDYYRVPASSRRPYGEDMKPPPAGQALGGVGEDPDVSSHPLPLGSRKVGSGNQAMGNIVSLPRTTVGMVTWGAMALAIGIPVMLLLGSAHLGDRLGEMFGGGRRVFAPNEGDD
jgi:hypothetical protein